MNEGDISGECDNRRDVSVLGILWALPATVIGLLFASLAVFGGRIQLVDGVIEAHGPLLRWLLSHCVPVRGAAALTLGHVVIARDERCLEYTRAHERAHVRQYELWGGFFLPAYLIASGWAWLRGGHYYHDNYFERAATQDEGAYRYRIRGDKR